MQLHDGVEAGPLDEGSRARHLPPLQRALPSHARVPPVARPHQAQLQTQCASPVVCTRAERRGETRVDRLGSHRECIFGGSGRRVEVDAGATPLRGGGTQRGTRGVQLEGPRPVVGDEIALGVVAHHPAGGPTLLLARNLKTYRLEQNQLVHGDVAARPVPLQENLHVIARLRKDRAGVELARGGEKTSEGSATIRTPRAAIRRGRVGARGKSYFFPSLLSQRNILT